MSIWSHYLFAPPRQISKPLSTNFTCQSNYCRPRSTPPYRASSFLLPFNRQQGKLASKCSFTVVSDRGFAAGSRISYLIRRETSHPKPAASSLPVDLVTRSSLTVSFMFKTITRMFIIGFLAWIFQAISPPPPRICGSPGGPPITGPRIKLRDGRHLAYKEHGVTKEIAKYKIVLVHGFGGSKHDASIATSDAVEEHGVYLVSFDRPGYGESDPDPKRTFKSIALDIQELADQLELGSKFYVIGTSMGGQVVWGCLKYIPHRTNGLSVFPITPHGLSTGGTRRSTFLLLLSWQEGLTSPSQI